MLLDAKKFEIFNKEIYGITHVSIGDSVYHHTPVLSSLFGRSVRVCATTGCPHMMPTTCCAVHNKIVRYIV